MTMGSVTMMVCHYEPVLHKGVCFCAYIVSKYYAGTTYTVVRLYAERSLGTTGPARDRAKLRYRASGCGNAI
jgi:hypothetical protein